MAIILILVVYVFFVVFCDTFEMYSPYWWMLQVLLIFSFIYAITSIFNSIERNKRLNPNLKEILVDIRSNTDKFSNKEKNLLRKILKKYAKINDGIFVNLYFVTDSKAVAMIDLPSEKIEYLKNEDLSEFIKNEEMYYYGEVNIVL